MCLLHIKIDNKRMRIAINTSYFYYKKLTEVLVIIHFRYVLIYLLFHSYFLLT